MAKKEMRMLVASEDVAGLVDHGFDVDAQIKNLGFEDKGIKTKLTQEAEGKFQEGETSLKLKGVLAAAVVTAAEKVEIEVGAEAFAEVRKAIDSGLLEGFVERKLSLVVPPGKVEAAAEALRAAGIMASAAETLFVEAETLRSGKPSSTEQAKAVEALKKCVKKETTYRVKYEKV